MVSASGSISLHGSSVQLLQPSAMAASENIVPKRLKIRISKVCSGSEAVSADARRSSQVSTPAIEDAKFTTSGNNFSDRVTERPHSHDLKARFPLNRGSVMTSTSDKEKRMTSKSKLQKKGDHADKETIISERYNVQISVPHPSKRGPVIGLDSPKAKRQKIGSGVMQQCAALLKKLMTHPSGWVFNQPVDPVALNIPDYFTIISEPMDLGTIKSKVDKKLYMNTEDFAADVRLTFSNAMIYNPPLNDVHIMAKELNAIFESGWKTLVAKWSTTCSMVGQQQKSNERLSKSLNSRGAGPKNQASCPKVSNKILLTSVPRQKPMNDPIEIPESKIPPRLRDQSAESARFRCSSGPSSSQKDLHKGNGNGSRPVYGVVSDMSRTSSTCINGSCESMSARSSLQNAFPSDADSEQSSGRVNDKTCHKRVRNKDIAASGTAGRQAVKLRPDSDGGVSAVDEEKVPSSHPPALGTNASSSGSASEEGWETNVYDGQLSPSKALRAAMLRSRFADTIVKAQEKTLLNNGERSDPLKLKQEKERLEKQQREEKARIEAEIRAAKAASRAREEMELREKREREREAARIALEKMERTVEIYENMDILGDLEKLGAYPGYISLYSESPLARLGLYIRDAYLEEDELENCNWDINLSDVVEEQDIHLVDNNGGLENCNRDADVEEGEIAC